MKEISRFSRVDLGIPFVFIIKKGFLIQQPVLVQLCGKLQGRLHIRRYSRIRQLAIVQIPFRISLKHGHTVHSEQVIHPARLLAAACRKLILLTVAVGVLIPECL
ncbi:hypothetical protein D3C75_998940 [compost metagenome]